MPVGQTFVPAHQYLRNAVLETGASDPPSSANARREVRFPARIPDHRAAARLLPICACIPAPISDIPTGGQVAEWSKARAWKVRRRETVSRVRIPSCPPPTFHKRSLRFSG